MCFHWPRNIHHTGSGLSNDEILSRHSMELKYNCSNTGRLCLNLSLNDNNISLCDVNLVAATQWSFFFFLMHNNCGAHFTRSQFEICMKNGVVSWWKSFAIKRQAIEIEILASGCGSEGTHAIEMKYKWENNGGLFRQCH